MRPRGWLRRMVLGCRTDEHMWRRTYGDERMARGATFVCERCPRKTDGPVDFYVDPTQADIDELRRQLNPNPVTVCEPCGTTRNEDVSTHLAALHPDQFFWIDADPNNGVSVIRASNSRSS